MAAPPLPFLSGPAAPAAVVGKNRCPTMDNGTALVVNGRKGKGTANRDLDHAQHDILVFPLFLGGCFFFLRKDIYKSIVVCLIHISPFTQNIHLELAITLLMKIKILFYVCLRQSVPIHALARTR
ncbi:hypothetical protein U9M48_005458 [Paspalum notatum var. saurae]